MEITELHKYLENEHLAEKFLQEKGIFKSYKKCPTCGGDKFMKINTYPKYRHTNVYQCTSCNAEYDLAKNTILEAIPTSASKFLGCLTYFANGNQEGYPHAYLLVDSWKFYRLFRLLLIGKRNIPKLSGKELTIYISYEGQKVNIGLKKSNSPDLAEVKFTRSRDKYGYIFKMDYKRLRKAKRRGIGRIDELEYFYRMCQKRILNYMGGKDLRELFMTLLEVQYRYNKSLSPFNDIIELIVKKKLNTKKVAAIFERYNVDN